MRYSIILLPIIAAATIDRELVNGFTPYVVTGACYTEVQDEPSPNPDSEVCENCNGTGKIGDGQVTFQCTVCDGTGKITKQELENLHGIINYKNRVKQKRSGPPKPVLKNPGTKKQCKL
tara:strand:- start:249 stop:605 length:357 start_codon:yes stop_codon:yes gene_type:complete